MRLVFAALCFLTIFGCSSPVKSKLIGKWEFSSVSEKGKINYAIPEAVNGVFKYITFNFIDTNKVFCANVNLQDGDTCIYKIEADSLVSFFTIESKSKPFLQLVITRVANKDLVVAFQKNSADEKFLAYKYHFKKVAINLNVEKEFVRKVALTKSKNNKNGSSNRTSDEKLNNFELIKEYLNHSSTYGNSIMACRNEFDDIEIVSNLDKATFSKNLDKFKNDKWQQYKDNDIIYNTKIENNFVNIYDGNTFKNAYTLQFFDFGVLMLLRDITLKEGKKCTTIGFIFVNKSKSNLEFDWALSRDRNAQAKILQLLAKNKK
jgi:hypothetical protein